MAIKSSFWNQWKAWPPCTQSQASPMTGLVLSRRIWVNNPGAVFAGAVQGTVIDLMFCFMKLNIWLALRLNILWKHISDLNMYTCEHWNIYLTIFYFHWQNVPKVLLSCVFFLFFVFLDMYQYVHVLLHNVKRFSHRNIVRGGLQDFCAVIRLTPIHISK